MTTSAHKKTQRTDAFANGVTVFVTGATGCIGRAVCAVLCEGGARVIALTRGPGASVPGAETCVVPSYDAVVRTDTMRSAVCIHLAWEAIPQRFAAAVARGVEPAASVRAVEHLTELGFRRIVFASSALVYGDRAAYARREDEHIDSPSQPYARAKWDAERIVLARGGAVARIANVYGPQVQEETVVADILKQLSRTDTIELRDVRAVVDFIHVSDVANALAVLACSSVQGVFHVSSGTGTSVVTLAQLITAIAGSPISAIVSTHEKPYVSSLVLDPTKTHATLGWRATVPLRAGIRATIAHYRQSALPV